MAVVQLSRELVLFPPGNRESNGVRKRPKPFERSTQCRCDVRPRSVVPTSGSKDHKVGDRAFHQETFDSGVVRRQVLTPDGGGIERLAYDVGNSMANISSRTLS